MCELSPDEERLYDKDVLAAKTRESGAWSQFKVSGPMERRKCGKDAFGTRRALPWKVADGAKTRRDRLVANGYQDPDLKHGLVETPGCVSLRSSHLQVVSLAALCGWRLWSVDVKNACHQSDGFGRGVFIQSPPEWLPGDSRRAWKLNAPAYGLNDAPVAFHRSLKRYLVNDADPLQAADFRLEASKFDPCPFFVYRGSGPAVGVIATHIDVLFGCGERDILQRLEKFLAARFGPVKVQKDNFTQIGMDILQKAGGSAEIAQENFPDLLCPEAASPSFWEDRTRPLSDEELQIC